MTSITHLRENPNSGMAMAFIKPFYQFSKNPKVITPSQNQHINR
jgi:hypothetical protein